MSSFPRVGTSKFTWTDSGAQTHDLQIELQKVRPAAKYRTYVRDSLDFSTREVIDIGGVYEVIGLIRYEDDPQGVLDLILAGIRGLALTYYDHDGVANVETMLVSPTSPDVVIDFDVDQSQFDEHMVEVRLRRTSGAAFPSWIF